MNYATLAATTQRLLKNTSTGRTITINRYAPWRNPINRQVTKGAPVLTATPYAVELPAAKGLTMFEAQIKAESLVIEQLRFFVLEAVGQTFAPLPQDEVTIDGEVWPIKGVNGCTPAKVTLTYNIMVAR